MYAEPSTKNEELRMTWLRRVGVLVGLLALLAAIFAYVERSTAAAISEQMAVATVHDIDGTSPTEHPPSPLDCTPHGQCSLHAVIPAAPFIEATGPNALEPAAEPYFASEIISPLDHPPRPNEIL